jgi:Collagen triple helix repeat (20 copies)
MRSHTTKRPRNRELRQWSTPSTFLAGVALFIALGGSAVAANSLIHAGNIAPGAVTSQAIRNGGVRPEDLSTKTRELLQVAGGVVGERGDTGSTGAPGTNGANGPNGPNGANGIDGTDGTDGIDGTNGTDGIDGTIAPLSATSGLTALPTASPPTTVIALAVPAGNYVVLAKTQLSHTGAGDTVDCVLKAGATSIDRVSMKTLPALAAIPVSLQAVTVTTSPSQLSVECDVLTANGSADFSSLIAIPTG